MGTKKCNAVYDSLSNAHTFVMWLIPLSIINRLQHTTTNNNQTPPTVTVTIMFKDVAWWKTNLSVEINTPIKLFQNNQQLSKTEPMLL